MAKICAVGKKMLKDGKMILVCDETRTPLLAVLQQIQKKEGYISDSDMQNVADQFGIHPVEVYSVVTFYSFLTLEKEGEHTIYVSNCIANEMAGADDLVREFVNVLKIKVGETTKDHKFTLKRTSCIGMCEHSPAILVDYKLVGNLGVDDVQGMINDIDNLENRITIKEPNTKREGSVVFSEIQKYAGLKKALEIGKDAVLETLKFANLKGRGGAGFPTGVKWSFTAAESDPEKYVVGNADEGEPGTFKDRILLTEYCGLLFEGMVIGGFTIGAKIGYLYLRAEYQSFLPLLNEKISQMKNDHALGQNIMGKEGFDFDLEIRLGSGAYVCGEETALIESLEGCRGELRNRPPYPVNTGYNGHPTIVNNVETFSTVTQIIAKGADWFKKIGTEKSTGTKLLSISGDCAKPGVYEMPFGTSLNALLQMVEAKDTQAVQVGGASGVCIPNTEFQRKIAFEDIPTGGSIIVFNKERDMLSVAENFLQFFKEESCGQCTPCREGIPVLLEGIVKIREKECSDDYLTDIFSLCETMQIASKCGLGQSAPNAFLSILENFKKSNEIKREER